jgi:hypothetical protein
MVTNHTVEGYEGYLKLSKELEKKKVKFYVLFKGSLDEKGKSWCDDCVKGMCCAFKIIYKLPQNIYL